MLKRLSRRPWIRAILCWFGALYIRGVYLTSRWTGEGAEVPAAFWDRGEPFILAFWHNRLLMMPFIWRRGVAISMLVSRHPDGEFITRMTRGFGITTVRGSSHKRGQQAIRDLLELLKRGQCVGITPDGPRGPRMRVARGVIAIARLSGAPIIPASYSTSAARRLRSWDRFTIAQPFGRGVFLWGPPIRVTRDDDPEEMRLQLEAALNTLTADADRRCGLIPVEPEPMRMSDIDSSRDEKPVAAPRETVP